MKLVLEDFMAKIRELEGKMSAVESNQVGLQKELLGKSILCKSLELQLKSTQEKLDYANLQLFGDRCQKLRLKTPKGESKKTDSNRQKEKVAHDEEKGSVLNFEVFKDTEKLNPELWLAK